MIITFNNPFRSKPAQTIAPAVPVPQPAAQETHVSFLSAIGKIPKAVFGWLESSKGQATVTAVETGAIGIATAFGEGAPVTAGINLINTWLGEIIKTETLAAAAGAQDGSGATKAAAVLSSMVPQLTVFLQSQGYTSAQVTAQANTINTGLVTVLNALGAPGAAPATTPIQTTIAPTA